MTPTPTPNHPSADPSITEIAPVYSSYSSASATTTVGSSSSAQRQPAPHFLRKQGTAINIDDEEEVEVREDDEEGQTEDDDLWNSIHDIPLDDYQTQMEIPIAPIKAPLAGLVTPQNEEVPAPDSEDVTYLQADANADRDCYGSPHYPEIMKHLKSVFKLQGFRKNQLKAITATLSGKDVFVLMPTGGGKSLCYQLPAICKTGVTKGVTFVISPLLALMNDQVWALKKLGVKVVEFNSDQTAAEKSEAKASLTGRGPRPDIVYITPEGVEKNDMLKNIFDKLYREKQLARFVIDEAHLISSWGRDFRESVRTRCLVD
jgi:superfamily II DNA helicase RecQ